jgi:hypothetical protein
MATERSGKDMVAGARKPSAVDLINCHVVHGDFSLARVRVQPTLPCTVSVVGCCAQTLWSTLILGVIGDGIEEQKVHYV